MALKARNGSNVFMKATPAELGYKLILSDSAGEYEWDFFVCEEIMSFKPMKPADCKFSTFMSF